MEESQIKELEKKLEEAKSERDRALWEIEQIEETWKKKFKCSSLSEANDLIEKLEEEQEKTQTQINEITSQIEKIMENVEE